MCKNPYDQVVPSLPGLLATRADLKDSAHLCQSKRFTVGSEPCILHRAFIANYAAAFL